MTTRAVFLDRDKTLIEDPGYIDDPAKVRLFDDVAEALKRLRRAGYRIVVVTNQSGVARGILTERRLDEIHRRLEELLESRGARLDAIYACPYLDGPEATVEAYRRRSDQRKPEPGMLLRAAGDLQLDLGRSWMIGDGARDVEAGRRAGCRTILLERDGADATARQAGPDHVVPSLQEAADMVCQADTHKTPDASESSGPRRPAEDDSTSSAEALRVLAQIRDLLERSARRRRQQDFSLLRLGGTLLQMLAVVAALWGLAALMSDSGAATARFALAIFLQVATLCAFGADRRE